jgi:flagellar hook-length control protein FliK
MAADSGQPKAGAILDTQLPVESAAKQLLSSRLKELSADMKDNRSNANRLQSVASITPALMAQPVSESAQRALALAMNEAGLGKGVASGVAGQTEASQALTARQSGLSALPNGLTATMQLAAVTAKTASNVEFAASAMATRLSQQTASSLSSVTPLVTTGSSDDLSGVLSMTPRLATPLVGGALPVMPVATPVGQAGWASELGQRVAWLAQGELREAQLQLHPRSLGPVEVRIAYGHEQQLNVSFTAANPAAREALDAALPRLREMFDQQGLNLADANISQQPFSDQRHRKSGEGEPGLDSGGWASEPEDLTEQALLSNMQMMGNGMLDAYA